MKGVLRTMSLREVIGISRNHISLLDFEPSGSSDSFLIREKSSDSSPHQESENHFLVMLSSLESLPVLLYPPTESQTVEYLLRKTECSPQEEAVVLPRFGLKLCH